MSKKKINGYTINLNEQYGRGNFGVVYQAEQDGTRIKCAVKMLDKMQIEADDYVRSAIFRQIEILKNLRNNNIVAFYDVMESERYYYIVQQCCETDLSKVIKKQQKIKEQQAIQYLSEICNGFMCLIKQGIVHRDLKPANIMLRQGQIKLGDFGLAKRCRNKRIKIGSSVGSPLYMSLELLKQQQYTSKCDVWAVGCVFYQMLHGKTPWDAKTQYNLVNQIQNKQFIIDPKLSKNTKHFLKKSLQKKQADRLSWDQLFIDPIFQGRFLKHVKRNKECVNKFKMIMADIRFKINAQNINLNQLFDRLGFSCKKQLVFKNFDEFIRLVNPAISPEEVVYFFEKLDVNDDGRISIKELEAEMQNNHISFERQPKHVQQSTRSNIDDQSFCSAQSIKRSRLNQDLQFKIKKCFIKLYKILGDRKLTLYKTFKAYDQDKKNRLTIDQFQKILLKLDSTLSYPQVINIFQHLDKDMSDTIQFDELNAYYCKVNGVPDCIDLPPQYYYAKGKVNYKHIDDAEDKNYLKKFFKNID